MASRESGGVPQSEPSPQSSRGLESLPSSQEARPRSGLPASPCGRRCAWLPPPVVLLCLLLYGATTSGRLGTWDADIYFTVTERLLSQGRLDIPHSIILSHEEWKGRGGRYYAPFDLGQSIANIPFYLVGSAAARIVAAGRSPGFRSLITRGTVAFGNVIFTGLTVWVVWAFARDVGWGRRGRTGAALLFGLATLAWPYAAIGFNQALAALGQTIALWGTARFVQSRAPADALLTGLGGFLGLFVRLNTILALPWCALAMALALRPSDLTFAARKRLVRSVLAFAFPVSLALLGALAYNYFRFERLFRTGYAGDPNAEFGFGHMPIQLAALLVSPAKGVVFYVPVTFLAVVGGVTWARRSGMKRRESGDPGLYSTRCVPWLFGGVCLSYLLFFSAMAYGHSGLHSWGPRFFVPLMPLIGVLAWAGYEAIRPNRWARAAAKLLIALSITIQLLAVTSDQGERIQSLSRRLGGVGFYEKGFFTFQGNMILDRARAVGEKAALLLYGPTPRGPKRIGARERPSEKNLVLAFPACPNFWWAYAFAMHALPRAALWAALFIGLLSILFFAWKTRQGLVDADAGAVP